MQSGKNDAGTVTTIKTVKYLITNQGYKEDINKLKIITMTFTDFVEESKMQRREHIFKSNNTRCKVVLLIVIELIECNGAL